MTADADPRRMPRVLDLAALVAGYAMAALLVKSFWPDGGLPNRSSAVVLAIAYLWLGLAMGGPLVLAIDRRARPPSDPARPSPRYTWAETAWLMIGAYWIVLAMFVVPARLRENPFLGVFPVVAAVLIRVFRPDRAASRDRPGWTHHTGLALLFTWPLAWVAMILLGKTLF